MTAPDQQQQQQQQEAGGHMQSEQLWEYFVVAGLPKVGLQTVQGDAGFLGTDQKYKPVFVDSLPHSSFDESCHLPPQLPTVSVSVCTAATTCLQFDCCTHHGSS
jgi:hypothetical protein